MILDILKRSVYNSAINGTLTENNSEEIINNDYIDYRNDLSFQIPDNWKCVRLSDITDYGINNSICGKDLTDDEWILELEDIEKDTGVLLKKVYQKERKAVSNKNAFVKGNVLYGKLRPYLNKCIIADADGYCSTEIVPMNLNNDILGEYLQIVFMSPYYLNFVNEKSYGTKMPRLGTKDAQNSLIPLPPLMEQKRIINKVQSIMKIIVETKPIENELYYLKSNFPKKLKKSFLQNIMHITLDNDAGWEIIKMKELVSISTGKKDANYGSENGMYNFFTCSKEPIKCDNYSFEGESILLAGNGNIGNINYYDGKFEAYQRTYVLQQKSDKIDLKYLYYHLLANWEEYNNYQIFGTAIPYIKLGNVQNYVVNCPSLEEQKKIVNKIEQILPLCDDIEKLVIE